MSKPEEYNPTEFNPELKNYELGIEYGQRLAEERIDEILDDWQISLCKCDVCKAVREIREAIKGEQK